MKFINRNNIRRGFNIVSTDFFVVFATIIFALVVEFLTYNLRLPGATEYLLDGLIFILLIKIGFKLYKDFKEKTLYKYIKKPNLIIIFIIIFSVIALISTVLTGVGIVRLIKSYYLDYARYFIIFLAIYILDINKKQIDMLLKGLVIFMIVQFPVVLIQSLTVEVYETTDYVIRDYYSGLLGYKSTAELGFLIVLAVSYCYGLVLCKKLDVKKFLFLVVYFLAMVLFVEVKLIILVLPAVIVFISLFFIKDRKILYIIGGTAIAVMVSIVLVGKIYPHFANVFSIEGMLETAGYQYADAGVSRLSSVPKALRNIEGETSTLLFGKGPGNGIEYYNGRYHFRIFHFSYIISEYGVLGFITMIGMYLYVLITSGMMIIKKGSKNVPIGVLGIALFSTIMISGIYSMSMMKISFVTVAWVIIGIIMKTKDRKEEL